MLGQSIAFLHKQLFISIWSHQMKTTQAKIKKVSLIFRWLFQVLIFLIPIIHILSWINAPTPIDVSGTLGFFSSVVPKGVEVLHSLSPSTKLIGCLVDAIPLIFIELILFFLIKLFKLYEQAEIFSIQNVNYIKKIGKALLLNRILKFICNGILSALLTWNNPPGSRAITLTVTDMHIGLILTSFLIILIGWIMAEGCQLREEQQLTI